MLKIIFVVPYAELRNTVQTYLAGARHDFLRFETTHLVGVEEVRNMKFNCDIIIARGITCAALREYHPGISVIEIPVTGYDVIRALDECRNRYSVRRIALIGAGSMIYGAPSLDRILDMEVSGYPVDRESEAERLIDSAMANGAQAIVGGLMTYNFAKLRGIPCTWIKSGPDAVKQAIDEAVRTAEITEKERERAEFFHIIMDYAHEGILAVDKNARITALNKSAQSILKREGPCLGLPIGEVFPSVSLLKVLEKGEEDLGTLEMYRDTYIAANLVPIKVGSDITGAVATFQNVSRIQEIERRIRKKIFVKGHTSKYTFADILGSSSGIVRVIQNAEKYSRIDANVLITGETGTGKELFAHSIHSASARSSGPFVAVNCAALPEQLLESELFGYADGAFTGAAKGGKAGLFELAHNGTIFLDEIGEIPLTLQAKLLRVLQEREIMRIGHDRVIPVDVRVVAATNLDLKKIAKEGGFRQDLLFRLDVLRIDVPPLRQRQGDIPGLVRRFLDMYAQKFGKPRIEVSPSALRALSRYEWPGNIRELMNLCERFTALSEGEVLDILDLEPMLDVSVGTVHRGTEDVLVDETPELSRHSGFSLEEAEMRAVSEAMKRANGNQSKAACLLGISRTSLWRKLKAISDFSKK